MLSMVITREIHVKSLGRMEKKKKKKVVINATKTSEPAYDLFLIVFNILHFFTEYKLLLFPTSRLLPLIEHC